MSKSSRYYPLLLSKEFGGQFNEKIFNMLSAEARNDVRDEPIAFCAFCVCMEGRSFGIEETQTAWEFFYQGWASR